MDIDEKLKSVFVKVFKDKKIILNNKMSAKDRKDWDSKTYRFNFIYRKWIQNFILFEWAFINEKRGRYN